ncbi:tRNA (N6-isopentenyl adenosine(37)-C2)-methylthiotransferase MiaB [Roseococcus sp. SDR]|uniref:tRNA (N6-isopentenyl adenosine(37)-C2)-methylthiotransferase MiaB n=1 Tax=Roseococcus sp. SDR TaxID=2835532 RepID=UPI001BCC8BF2|nr:tRNA (N6-isopentenyl adenosine(37)-C2)-methylthiotransferase MiaB [Roseococcus sp. SDR]MBS7791736.1 tRNA (N6-isopentenyl adenosine(37)-C2)-methylthiotransferase MiaB [Roseococcus sp. SDR]MBV1847050.1 tRNA (N6-isopentenyl adenosine(37)-C2)-methylthiotransferase MiaB [Roseococcus sp. SDR]
MTDTLPPPSGKKRLFLRSWGCQMNVYDSARMADVLAPLGYAPVDAPEGADMIILNTCHIREKATEKLFSELGRLRQLKQAREAEGGEMVLAVAGCVAQAEGAEITARAPYVDIVLGPQSYHKLPEMVARAARTGPAVVETDFPVEEKFDFLPEVSAPQGITAFLTIQEGCDKFCSFCVVPYTRGAEYSRPVAAVLAEARKLAGQGAREITLLGQNVNAYHGAAEEGGEWGLAQLLRALAEIPGLDRLRYTTSHPRDMDAALIAAHRDIPAVMPFLHLPVQSGSDRVLAAMNRGHTAAEYLALVERLREARPDLALSTDIIVGHPGETEADHEATMALIRRVKFAQAFSFKYSPRPGTPAAGAPHRVDEATKDRRLQEVQALLRDQQAEFNASLTGQTVPVLFTGPGRQPGQLSGRTPWLQPVHVPGPLSLIGETAPVFIRAGNPNSLAGELAQQEKTAA